MATTDNGAVEGVGVGGRNESPKNDGDRGQAVGAAGRVLLQGEKMSGSVRQGQVLYFKPMKQKMSAVRCVRPVLRQSCVFPRAQCCFLAKSEIGHRRYIRRLTYGDRNICFFVATCVDVSPVGILIPAVLQWDSGTSCVSTPHLRSPITRPPALQREARASRSPSCLRGGQEGDAPLHRRRSASTPSKPRTDRCACRSTHGLPAGKPTTGSFSTGRAPPRRHGAIHPPNARASRPTPTRSCACHGKRIMEGVHHPPTPRAHPPPFTSR